MDRHTFLFVRASLLLAFLLLLTAGTTNADAAVARHGVTATIAHRTLTVSGDHNANRIALRVKRTASSSR